MAFRKKASAILDVKPDLLIVPECEHPDRLIFEEGIQKPNDVFWYGHNQHKGIGVLSYSDYNISLLEIHNSKFEFVLPLKISNKKEEFILFSIWCQKPERLNNYGIHTWNAIHYYLDILENEKVILAGDFNSSSIWDKVSREANHSNIVNFLKTKNIESVYHLFHKQNQGERCNFVYDEEESTTLSY